MAICSKVRKVMNLDQRAKSTDSNIKKDMFTNLLNPLMTMNEIKDK